MHLSSGLHSNVLPAVFSFLPLHESLELLMQHVSPVHHQSHVLGRGVNALPILYGPLKHVGELGLGAQEVGTDKIDHAPGMTRHD